MVEHRAVRMLSATLARPDRAKKEDRFETC